MTALATATTPANHSRCLENIAHERLLRRNRKRHEADTVGEFFVEPYTLTAAREREIVQAIGQYTLTWGPGAGWCTGRRWHDRRDRIDIERREVAALLNKGALRQVSGSSYEVVTRWS